MVELVASAVGLGAAGASVVLAGMFNPRFQLFGPCIWRGPRGTGMVAVTFDDGPHPRYTPRVVEMVEKAGGRATFFCVGQAVKEHPGLTRELSARGHELGNHTWRHSLTTDLFFTEKLLCDLRRCQDALVEATGTHPAWFRPAVGIRNPPVHNAARAMGLPVVTWSLGARDGAVPLTEGRARGMGRRASGGDILALHDGAILGDEARREHTLRHLPALLEELVRSSLRMVTLSELLAAPAQARI